MNRPRTNTPLERYIDIFDRTKSTVNGIDFIKQYSMDKEDRYNRLSYFINITAYLHGGESDTLVVKFNKNKIMVWLTSNIYSVITQEPYSYALFAQDYQNLITLVEDLSKTSVEEFSYDKITYLTDKELEEYVAIFKADINDQIEYSLSNMLVKEINNNMIDDIFASMSKKPSKYNSATNF
jgi:hypothetical protein